MLHMLCLPRLSVHCSLAAIGLIFFYPTVFEGWFLGALLDRVMLEMDHLVSGNLMP